jgi:hypothetical protein
VPSAAYKRWSQDRQHDLDEFEAAHRAVGGGGRGRRYATQQINHAYTVMVSSQFQGFCRDLHSEAVSFLERSTAPQLVAQTFGLVMMQGRKLDAGNPNPGNIGSDFARFGMNLWTEVAALDTRNRDRQRALDELSEWRNAIAHQDWSKVGGSPSLSLPTVRRWRSTCRQLAKSFDRVVGARLAAMVGAAPW